MISELGVTNMMSLNLGDYQLLAKFSAFTV